MCSTSEKNAENSQPGYRLERYGWNESLSRLKKASPYKDFLHGRISVTHRTCFEVVSEEGDYICELTGNMLYGRDASEFPCTGDWVLFQAIAPHKGIILDMLPRKKTLYRLKSGTVSEKQALAAYVNKAFIVQSLDRNFNVRRIERILLQLSAESIQGVLVLTKTDLGFDRESTERALKHLTPMLPVFYTSIHSPDSIDALRKSISPVETVVFTGSSGVGKSSLINALCRKERQQTADISQSTRKGTHTTTRREMILLDKSGILIDTPGIKVFGITCDDTESLSELLDIQDYEGQCRFSDCRHVNEKGCAVIRAVKNGELEEQVYQSYLKLRKEAWHYTASVQEKRKQERNFSKMVKEVKKGRKKT